MPICCLPDREGVIINEQTGALTISAADHSQRDRPGPGPVPAHPVPPGSVLNRPSSLLLALILWQINRGFRALS